jgi:hypothetical protein
MPILIYKKDLAFLWSKHAVILAIKCMLQLQYKLEYNHLKKWQHVQREHRETRCRRAIAFLILMPILIYKKDLAFLWSKHAVILALIGGVCMLQLQYKLEYNHLKKWQHVQREHRETRCRR